MDLAKDQATENHTGYGGSTKVKKHVIFASRCFLTSVNVVPLGRVLSSRIVLTMYVVPARVNHP